MNYDVTVRLLRLDGGSHFAFCRWSTDRILFFVYEVFDFGTRYSRWMACSSEDYEEYTQQDNLLLVNSYEKLHPATDYDAPFKALAMVNTMLDTYNRVIAERKAAA